MKGTVQSNKNNNFGDLQSFRDHSSQQALVAGVTLTPKNLTPTHVTISYVYITFGVMWTISSRTQLSHPTPDYRL